MRFQRLKPGVLTIGALALPWAVTRAIIVARVASTPISVRIRGDEVETQAWQVDGRYWLLRVAAPVATPRLLLPTFFALSFGRMEPIGLTSGPGRGIAIGREFLLVPDPWPRLSGAIAADTRVVRNAS
jgi:hypothetical protein